LSEAVGPPYFEPLPFPFQPLSSLTTVNNSRRGRLVLDVTIPAATRLNTLNDAHGGRVTRGDLAEDNVAAVEPGGNDGGDEELGAVGVGAGVGHGEEEGLVVGELEALVGELLAVDGFAARALQRRK